MKYGNALSGTEMQHSTDLRASVPPLALLHDLQEQVGVRFDTKIQTMFQFEVDTLFKVSEPFAIVKTELERNNKALWLASTTRELISPFVEDEIRKVAYVLANSNIPLHHTLQLNREAGPSQLRKSSSSSAGSSSIFDGRLSQFITLPVRNKDTTSHTEPQLLLPVAKRRQGKLVRQKQRQKRTCKLIEQAFGPDSQETLTNVLRLAECHRKLQQLDKALRCCLYINNLLERKFEQGNNSPPLSPQFVLT